MTTASQYVPWAVLLGLACLIANAEDSPQLTLAEAHETALRNHPQISVADLKALAARQVTRQFRSAFFPTLSANAVAVGTANDNTRLSAIGALNNPSIFDRNAEGLILSQLITDFGRTANLAASAKLRAQAEANNAQATREQILLAVDGAFFAAQQAQSVTRVAKQTVAARQLFLEQVSVLATNKLRSELDVSFAKVNFEDGKLLLSKAQNDLQAAFAQLANFMGLREPQTYRLVEQPMPPEVSTNVSEFVQLALHSRPDLLSLRNSWQGALKFARAEKALHYPTLSAVGSAGVVPIGDAALGDNYAAAGLILTLPLYAGGLYSARQQEAELRTRAADENLRDLENNVVRDVRIAWLNAQNAFERLRITGELLDNAQQSFDLARALYQRHQFDCGVQPGPAQPALGPDRLCRHPIRIFAPAVSPGFPGRGPALSGTRHVQSRGYEAGLISDRETSRLAAWGMRLGVGPPGLCSPSWPLRAGPPRGPGSLLGSSEFPPMES